MVAGADVGVERVGDPVGEPEVPVGRVSCSPRKLIRFVPPVPLTNLSVRSGNNTASPSVTNAR